MKKLVIETSSGSGMIKQDLYTYAVYAAESWNKIKDNKVKLHEEHIKNVEKFFKHKATYTQMFRGFVKKNQNHLSSF